MLVSGARVQVSRARRSQSMRIRTDLLRFTATALIFSCNVLLIPTEHVESFSDLLNFLLMHSAQGEECVVSESESDGLSFDLLRIHWSLRVWYIFCCFYFEPHVHVLRSAITDATSKSVFPSLTSELRPNCPTTVPTPPVAADYNMK
jgi:hypothetical protein